MRQSLTRAASTRAQRRREEAKAREAQARRLQDDPWKAAQLKLAVKVQAPEDGSLPPQRNVGKLEFTLQEDEARGAVEASVAVPKFLDSSAIDVDVHPRWFQLVFQGHALLLHFPSEVSSDRARVRRMPTSGKLVITVPTVAGPRAGAAATASPAAALKPASAKSERDRARVRYHPRRRHPAHDDDDDAAAGEAAAPAEDKAARVSAVAAAIGVDESEVPPLE
jgi:protein TilB